MSVQRFAGKVMVVTGAAQGIGRDVALRLAREGARVALVDRSDLVEEVRQEAPPRRIPRNTAPPSEQEKVRYQQIVDQALFRSPMKRFGTTDEQAAPILFLASDEASYHRRYLARGRRRPRLNHGGRTASD